MIAQQEQQTSLWILSGGQGVHEPSVPVGLIVTEDVGAHTRIHEVGEEILMGARMGYRHALSVC